MFSDERLERRATVGSIRGSSAEAHAGGVAVEAELAPLAGVAGDWAATAPDDLRLTDPAAARRFVEQTGIDALAVNIGQVHLHGRQPVRLDLDRLRQLAELPVPLVLHGATSVDPRRPASGGRLGVRKINVGSRLKQAYFGALRDAPARSGASTTIPTKSSARDSTTTSSSPGRLAMQHEVGA